MAYTAPAYLTFTQPTDFGPEMNMVRTTIVKFHGTPVARIIKSGATGAYAFRLNKADGWSKTYKTRAGVVKAVNKAIGQAIGA